LRRNFGSFGVYDPLLVRVVQNFLGLIVMLYRFVSYSVL
jgi:hypothetical protein